MTEVPNAPRPDDALVREIADALARVEHNYHREGSGPGSRFEGRLLEDAQAELVVRMVKAAVAQERWNEQAARNAGVTVTRDQREGLDPILGTAVASWGFEAGDLIMAAYHLGRQHQGISVVHDGRSDPALNKFRQTADEVSDSEFGGRFTVHSEPGQVDVHCSGCKDKPFRWDEAHPSQWGGR